MCLDTLGEHRLVFRAFLDIVHAVHGVKVLVPRGLISYPEHFWVYACVISEKAYFPSTCSFGCTAPLQPYRISSETQPERYPFSFPPARRRPNACCYLLGLWTTWTSPPRPLLCTSVRDPPYTPCRFGPSHSAGSSSGSPGRLSGRRTRKDD